MKNPKFIFHGGCLGCSMQDEKGIGYCTGCQFFKPDWNKPDLSNNNFLSEPIKAPDAELLEVFNKSLIIKWCLIGLIIIIFLLFNLFV